MADLAVSGRGRAVMSEQRAPYTANERHCEECGALYVVTSARQAQKRFCGRRCRNRLSNRRLNERRRQAAG